MALAKARRGRGIAQRSAAKETGFMVDEHLLDFAKDMKWERKIDEVRTRQSSGKAAAKAG